jgi:hypothetical protein
MNPHALPAASVEKKENDCCRSHPSTNAHDDTSMTNDATNDR